MILIEDCNVLHLKKNQRMELDLGTPQGISSICRNMYSTKLIPNGKLNAILLISGLQSSVSSFIVHKFLCGA